MAFAERSAAAAPALVRHENPLEKYHGRFRADGDARVTAPRAAVQAVRRLPPVLDQNDAFFRRSVEEGFVLGKHRSMHNGECTMNNALIRCALCIVHSKLITPLLPPA